MNGWYYMPFPFDEVEYDLLKDGCVIANVRIPKQKRDGVPQKAKITILDPGVNMCGPLQDIYVKTSDKVSRELYKLIAHKL